MRAVHVGVTQDADFAVAQAGQNVAPTLPRFAWVAAPRGGARGLGRPGAAQSRRVVGAVRVDANGDRDVVNFVVGKQPVALDFPGVEHLAAQGQDGLAFFVAAHLGAATGRIALDQKHFVVCQVFAFAVGQFAGQDGHT